MPFTISTLIIQIIDYFAGEEGEECEEEDVGLDGQLFEFDDQDDGQR